jgi:hypothetical protein
VGVFNRGGFGEVLAVILLMQFLNVCDDALVLRVFFLLGWLKNFGMQGFGVYFLCRGHEEPWRIPQVWKMPCCLWWWMLENEWFMRWRVCWTLLFLLVLAAEGLFAMRGGDEDVLIGSPQHGQVTMWGGFGGQIRSDTSLDNIILVISAKSN